MHDATAIHGQDIIDLVSTHPDGSRASMDRMLNPSNPSLTVASLGKAAAAHGRKVELRLIPA